MPKNAEAKTIVVSALERDRRSLVIEKRGTPKAVLPSIREYARLASPEPDALKLLGEESQRSGTDKLTDRQIDLVIKAARLARRKRG